MKKIFSCAFLFLLAAAPAYPQQFSLKIGGGLAFLNGDDYNKGIVGLDDYLADTALSLSGAHKEMKNGLNFQGEFIFHINPSIGIGLGGGYYQAGKESTEEWRWGSSETYWDDKSTFKPKLTVIPLFLNIHYALPISSKLGLDLFAGPSLLITKFDFSEDYSSTQLHWRYQSTFVSKNTAFGFQGGLGLDLEISSHLGFFLDGSYRYAKVGEVKGDWTEKGTSVFGPYEDMSSNYSLWYFEYKQNGKIYPRLGLIENAPEGAEYSNVRKGVLKLSGISVVGGLKIRF